MPDSIAAQVAAGNITHIFIVSQFIGSGIRAVLSWVSYLGSRRFLSRCAPGLGSHLLTHWEGSASLVAWLSAALCLVAVGLRASVVVGCVCCSCCWSASRTCLQFLASRGFQHRCLLPASRGESLQQDRYIEFCVSHIPSPWPCSVG